MSSFDRIVKNGSIAETLHPYSPAEREHDHNIEEDCEYCHDTMRIGDWRTYMKAFRKARTLRGYEFLQTWTVEELLILCRDIRDGWTGRVTGTRYHEEECPICMYSHKGGNL